MGSKAKIITAIDMGAFNVKILQGILEGQNLKINKAIKVPVPEDTYEDGMIRKPDLMREALKMVVKENRLAGTSVCCTIESSQIVVREMTLPAVKPKEMKEMIGYELQNYLPIELSQYVVQSKLLSETSQDGVRHANIMVAALPKEIAETHLNMLETLDLKPMSLDVHSNCQIKLLTGRSINNNQTIDDKTIAILDIGHQKLNINVVEKGIYKFNRLLNMGGRDIDGAIANYRSISLDEARILKTEMQPLDRILEDITEETRIQNLCKNVVDSWLDEVERIFKFYTSRNTGNAINTIYITGGGSRIRGLEWYVSQSLGIHAESIHEISGLITNQVQGSFELSKFINSLGAMIRL